VMNARVTSALAKISRSIFRSFSPPFAIPLVLR
jgi:hypothetical protein